MRNIFPLKTLNNFLGNDRLPFTDAVGILLNLEVLVNDHHAAFVQIRQHLQLRVDDFSGIAGILSDVVRQDHQLILHHCDPLFHCHILIIVHNAVTHGNAGHETDHQDQQENTGTKASKFDHALQLIPYSRKTFFIPYFHNYNSSKTF